MHLSWITVVADAAIFLAGPWRACTAASVRGPTAPCR
jgi:hypothetical protein